MNDYQKTFLSKSVVGSLEEYRKKLAELSGGDKTDEAGKTEGKDEAGETENGDKEEDTTQDV